MLRIRDPIHKFILLSPEELTIVDSAPFQRLRNIKQLATSYLVYPGAEHTRFSHSLGVMHLAGKAFDAAMDNYYRRTGSYLFDDEVSRAWYRQVLRLIALTHDLGHGPFSHAFERRFKKGIEHEEFTRKILFDTEIRRHIQGVSDAFLRDNKDKILDADKNKYIITPELLWMIYGEKDASLKNGYDPKYNIIKDLMDGGLDCDKMDYLLRDAYYCGVNYGTYDVDKLISALTVFKDEEKNTYRLAIDHSGLYAFEEFVVARYHMFMQVYFHKTRRYLDKLLIDAIEELGIPEMGLKTSIDKYMGYDDCVIMSLLNKKAKDPSNINANQLLRQQVMSCVYETHGHNDSRIGNSLCNKIFKELQEHLGADYVWEDFASKVMVKYFPKGRYDELSSDDIPIFLSEDAGPGRAMDESVLLQGLRSPINTRRIYVNKVNKGKAKAIIKGLLS